MKCAKHEMLPALIGLHPQGVGTGSTLPARQQEGRKEEYTKP
ncbi:MAG: hypothetical protein FD176_176 [Rhodospirillaceae bacterium]|nr:MAG: hypothetical protein FD176_176 [Rhodospirillaceae bacterium]TNC98694.1 MAG: hypothetical protein FD119_165 [Stygiobacter sp.]